MGRCLLPPHTVLWRIVSGLRHCHLLSEDLMFELILPPSFLPFFMSVFIQVRVYIVLLSLEVELFRELSDLSNWVGQDSPDFNGTGYDLTKDGFGILDKTPERWINFHQEIARLNAGAEEFTTFVCLS